MVNPAQVRAARAALRMGQEELADASRVSRSTVAQFERESRATLENNLLAVRKALEDRGCTFGTLPNGQCYVGIPHEIPEAAPDVS